MSIVQQVQDKIKEYNSKDKDMNYFMYQLFLECEHGDEDHKIWLYNKFIDFLNKYKG